MAAVSGDVVVAAVAARSRAAAEARARRQVLRVAVALAAALQLALALPMLVGAFLGPDPGTHAIRELACLDVALAVGFLLAAYRPDRARTFLPVALVLVALLGVTSGVDLARGVTSFGHELGHLLAVVQAGLLWALGRLAADSPAGARVLPGAGVAGTTR
jgi:hypothetical protein